MLVKVEIFGSQALDRCQLVASKGGRYASSNPQIRTSVMGPPTPAPKSEYKASNLGTCGYLASYIRSGDEHFSTHPLPEMPAPAEFLEFVDANADTFIERLKSAVAYRSISGDLERRQDVIDMGEWLNARLNDVGVETKLVTPKSTSNGRSSNLDLPPVIFGKIGDDKDKKTVLVYGHYDVQPAPETATDGWDTLPFVLTLIEEDGEIKMYGRGSTDDKGPVLGWLNVLQYYHEDETRELPVNFRCCFEGMEESGSASLDDVLKKELEEPGSYLRGVNWVCICDNYWLNTRTPALTYGLRGITYYTITVEGATKDLHSGIYGGMIYEPMTILTTLMGKLVDIRGNILIPGVESLVAPPDEDELAIYEALDYKMADLKADTGVNVSIYDNKVDTLMARMRYPSLSLHGIEGAASDPGTQTIIPHKVTGKFSIRTVPPQTSDLIDTLVKDYLNLEFSKLQTKATMAVESVISNANPWYTLPTDDNFKAATIATKNIYGKEPDLMREGGSIPVTLTFQDALGVGVMLLPMGRGDDAAHSPNEKLDKDNFIRGTKLLGSYLYEIASISAEGKK